MCCLDNYEMWRRHDAEQQARLDKLPKCCECGEAIQDEQCYVINDEMICEKCMKDNHRVFTEDFVCL